MNDVAAAPADWYAADSAYLAHHHTCPQCLAAGLNPDGVARCPEGARLWDAYSQAGMPPHFLWLRPRQGNLA